MLAIYRGEDTDFAGAEPLQVKIDTDLDLSGGYTAELLFGSVVKTFDAEEVETKTLGLSFTAAETSSFFPGRGFATVKVYDPEGRVAILKRFVIDVRFRDYSDSKRITPISLGEALQAFQNVQDAAVNLSYLTGSSSKEDIVDTVNALIQAARKRVEFEPVPEWEMEDVDMSKIDIFNKCMENLSEVALSLKTGDEEVAEAAKTAINAIIGVLGNLGDDRIRHIDFSKVKTPAASVNSIRDWALDITNLLKKINLG